MHLRSPSRSNLLLCFVYMLIADYTTERGGGRFHYHTVPEHPIRHCFGINSSDSSANPDQKTTAAKRTFRESICHLGVLVACQSLLSFSPRTICQIPTSLNAHSIMTMVQISRELTEVASMPTLWNMSNQSFSMPLVRKVQALVMSNGRTSGSPKSTVPANEKHWSNDCERRVSAAAGLTRVW